MKCLSGSVVLLAVFLLAGCGPPKGSDEAADAGEAAKPIVVNGDNFEDVVLNSDKPVLVDFWATWCLPCRQIAPVVKELAAEYKGRAVVAKLDVDDAGSIAAQYEVNSIPTLIVFHKGEEVSRVVGVVGKAKLKKNLDAALEEEQPSDP